MRAGRRRTGGRPHLRSRPRRSEARAGVPHGGRGEAPRLGVTGDVRDEEAGQGDDVLAFGVILAACLPDARRRTGCPRSWPGSRGAAARPSRASVHRPPRSLACWPRMPSRRPSSRRRLFRRCGGAAPDAARGGAGRCGRGGAGAGPRAAGGDHVVAADSPEGVALPAPPRRSAPPTAAADDPGAQATAAAIPSRPAVPAADSRALAVSVLARMRRDIDVGMAVTRSSPVRDRAGHPGHHAAQRGGRRRGGGPAAAGGAAAGADGGTGAGRGVPGRAAGLSALLAEIPVRP